MILSRSLVAKINTKYATTIEIKHPTLLGNIVKSKTRSFFPLKDTLGIYVRKHVVF